MDNDKTDRISRRAYELWEAAGRPHGHHDEHWLAAEREFDTAAPEAGAGAQDGPTSETTTTRASDPHPGMMGDGTEEQNLDQPGNPDARITEDEVRQAFSEESTRQD